MTSALTGTSRDITHAGEIFVVDDDANVRDLLRAILPLEGFPVTCFKDGETFIDAASNRIPVCVFLDVVMPGRSGLDILKELSRRNYKPPVFLISAHDHLLGIDDTIKTGARGFLRKPFDPYAAVERVRDAVSFWTSCDEHLDDTAPAVGRDQIRLTTRESQVLAHVKRGLCSKDIADTLGIGKRMVDDMRMKTMKKLGAKTSADLVQLVMNMD
jgi:FixJ family two-component response regulator